MKRIKTLSGVVAFATLPGSFSNADAQKYNYDLNGIAESEVPAENRIVIVK